MGGLLLYAVIAAIIWACFKLAILPIIVSMLIALRAWSQFRKALAVARTVRIIQANEAGLTVTIPSADGPVGVDYPKEKIRQVWVHREFLATAWILAISLADGSTHFLRFEPGRSPVAGSMQQSLRQALQLPDEPGRPLLRLARPIRG